MASTPMDLDTADSSPANGTPSTSLNIARATLQGNSALTDVIARFRPNKVPKRPSVAKKDALLPQLGLKASTSAQKSVFTAASVLPYTPRSSSPLKKHTATSCRESSPAAPPLTPTDFNPLEEDIVKKASDSSQLFKREDIKEGRTQPYILSLDFDDPGELLMTSESDETIQIYKVRDGRHDKQLLSKKYGVKLAKFTHTTSSIIYASTKINDAIRYLTTHDNAFVRYFEGHEAAVTCLAMHPGQDEFISCSKDNTVRFWHANTKNATGLLHLSTPYLSAYDPSGQILAVGSPNSGQVLLYDHRKFDKAPFSTFDIVESCGFADSVHVTKDWTKLEFSNDGKSILLGTKGSGHFLIDSFEGTLRAYLHKPESGTGRLAAGEEPSVNGASSSNSSNVESSGDCCFTTDGRYVISGSKNKVLVWDTLGQVDGDKTLEPTHTMESPRQASVVAFNPRFNFFAAADQDLVLWLPDPHA